MSHSIEVKNLRKKYRVYFEKPALIRNILPFLVSQGKAQEFWALDGVSFSMQNGECVGIIGPNGSGKSTILSILAGVSAPTEGEVSISGRVSSLLSLGAGFNFELTGQENVYLNGAILGLSKTQIDAIYDDIVAYADLGRFMNAKLSTYSSGMNMRLGFAIAVMVPFDVLLMDEILAVGDLSFQTKCFRTMRSSGRTRERRSSSSLTTSSRSRRSARASSGSSTAKSRRWARRRRSSRRTGSATVRSSRSAPR